MKIVCIMCMPRVMVVFIINVYNEGNNTNITYNTQCL